MNGWFGIIFGVLIGAALRLYVEARRQRKANDETVTLRFDHLRQDELDAALASGYRGRSHADADPHELAQVIANQTGRGVVGREVGGEGIVVAIPDEPPATTTRAE
jgi:hypothetical protein